jgi:hypothetical protein
MADAQAIERASEITYPISQIFVKDVAEWLASRCCILIKAPPSAEFITSDDPVVIIKADKLHDLDGGVASLLKTQDLDVLIPLLPTVACVWKSGAPAATLNVVATDEYCHKVNTMITKSAYQQVYSRSKERLSFLAHSGSQPTFIRP